MHKILSIYFIRKTLVQRTAKIQDIQADRQTKGVKMLTIYNS